VVAVIAALTLLTAALAFPGLFGQTAPTASVVVVSRNPLLDQPAPDFTLQTLDGQTVTLSQLRGKPVIVNFWASWCVPCREEFPLLVSAYQQYSGQGLQIVGVVHDDGPQTATDFAKQYGATWPLVLDPNEVAWNAYNGSLVPVSYYIDRDGVIRAVSYGPPPSGFLDDQIRQIL
jgi:cytochrome c biogenesis protein CcmG, thiol:disulfide interchange protein DsbE